MMSWSWDLWVHMATTAGRMFLLTVLLLTFPWQSWSQTQEEDCPGQLQATYHQFAVRYDSIEDCEMCEGTPVRSQCANKVKNLWKAHFSNENVTITQIKESPCLEEEEGGYASVKLLLKKCPDAGGKSKDPKYWKDCSGNLSSNHLKSCPFLKQNISESLPTTQPPEPTVTQPEPTVIAVAVLGTLFVVAVLIILLISVVLVCWKWKNVKTFAKRQCAAQCRGRREAKPQDDSRRQALLDHQGQQQQEVFELQQVQHHGDEESGDINQLQFDRAERARLIQNMPFIGPQYANPVPRGPVQCWNRKHVCTTSSRPSKSRVTASRLVDALVDSVPLCSRVSPEGSGHSSLDPLAQHH